MAKATLEASNQLKNTAKKRHTKKPRKQPLKTKELGDKTEKKGSLRVAKASVTCQVALKTKVVIPKSVDDASCNWKKLCEKLTPGKPFKRKAAVPLKENDSKSVKTTTSEKVQSNVSKDETGDVWFDDVDPLLLESEEGKHVTLDKR